MTARPLPAPPPALAWVAALREPEQALTWSLAEWERVVRSARRLRLLGRLAEGLDVHGLLGQVPAQPRRHLIAEQRLSRWRTAGVLWTMERADAVLHGADYARVLLKGAAYIGQDLPIATGRLPSDLDILVPKAHLSDAQQRLTRAGWNTIELDDHDQRYYYEWSHEVPPMRHPLLTVELDLHHNILPPSRRAPVDADALLARLRPSKWPGWQVLDPADQVLHSAAHLFFDSEARDRLRDLVDLDGLFRHFGSDAAFFDGLRERATELHLEEPLALACLFCGGWLQTPLPADFAARVATAGPGPLRRAWLLPLWEQVLMPNEPDVISRPAQDAAALALLARHHFLRMPLGVLLPHLWHKLRSTKGGADNAGAAPDRPEA